VKDSDIKLIRFVGIFSLGLGITLLFATIIGAIIILYAGSTNVATPITLHEIAQLVLAFAMSLIATVCGAQIERFHPPVITDVQSLRLAWTALFAGMIIASVVGANLMPSLGLIALAEAVLLLAIRRAVIRASGF
jgi:hypothetical protein